MEDAADSGCQEPREPGDLPAHQPGRELHLPDRVRGAEADGRRDAAADPSPQSPHHAGDHDATRGGHQRPDENVLPVAPRGRPAQLLCEREQALPPGLPAARSAAQLHQEFPSCRQLRPAQSRSHVRAEHPALRGQPCPQGGVRGPVAERRPGLLHRLAAALPATQGQDLHILQLLELPSVLSLADGSHDGRSAAAPPRGYVCSQHGLWFAGWGWPWPVGPSVCNVLTSATLCVRAEHARRHVMYIPYYLLHSAGKKGIVHILSAIRGQRGGHRSCTGSRPAFPNSCVSHLQQTYPTPCQGVALIHSHKCWKVISTLCCKSRACLL